MSPRQVSPLDRGAEAKLVAILAAVGSPLGRREIFSRVDDEFTTEEDLARCLGRLVADGRLVRGLRPRPGKEAEAVYSVQSGTGAPPLAQVVQTSAQAPEPQPQEEPMSIAHTKRKIAEYFAVNPGWINTKAMAAAIGISRGTVGPVMRTMLEDREIESIGSGRGLQYAARGTPLPAQLERKGAGSKATEKAPLRNLAEFGAPAASLPVPARKPGKIAWAITDKGDVAINDGTGTITLSPEDIAYGVSFLERTQLIWQHRA